MQALRLDVSGKSFLYACMLDPGFRKEGGVQNNRYIEHDNYYMESTQSGMQNPRASGGMLPDSKN